MSRIEHVYGTRFDDKIKGDGHSNLLVGRRGEDRILGLANPTDRFGELAGLLALDYLIGGPGRDNLDGGANLDVAVFGDARRGVTVDLVRGTATGQGRDVLASTEAVEGTRFKDTMIGDGGDNFFEARAGNDTISGGEGTDIIGYFSARNAVKVDLRRGRSSGHGADRLIGVEDIYGSRKGDNLKGDDGPNRVWAMEGNDVVSGFGGSDTLLGRAGTDNLDGGADIDACVGEKETACERNPATGARSEALEKPIELLLRRGRIPVLSGR